MIDIQFDSIAAIICLTIAGAFAYGIKRNKVEVTWENIDVFASMICAFIFGIWCVSELIEAFFNSFK